MERLGGLQSTGRKQLDTTERLHFHFDWAPLAAQTAKNLPTMQETQVQPLGWEDPLEKEMTTHSSTLAQTEEPGGL